MADKINAQIEVFHHLSRVYDNLKKKGRANITNGMIQSRLNMLEAHWKLFEAQHAELMLSRTAEEEKHEYFTKDCYSIAEEAFMDQQAQLLDMREEIVGTRPHATNTTLPSGQLEGGELRHRALLPRINIPTFDGRYSEWAPFHDTFESLVIKDTSLNNVDRLYYLRGCLKGEAANLIRNIKTTESNFKRAWTVLQERFQNKRRLVRAQLTSLLDLQPIKKESSAELKRLYYETWDVVDALADMDRPDPTDWVVHLTVERLDLQSRREWESSLGSTTEPPTLEDLKKFMDSRIHSVEGLEDRQGDRRGEATCDKRPGSKAAQVYQETVFGWILTGGVKGSHGHHPDNQGATVQFCSVHADLTRMLERFWEQEEIQVKATLSLDEQACEDHFLATHRRTSEGRFVVRLPFRTHPDLGESKPAAVRTLASMQRRFHGDAEFYKAYKDFMQDYEDLGHMQLTHKPSSGLGYYLPHHGIMKLASTTTKLRVVFNGSMPTSSGKSLNDFVHIGVNLLPALSDVLLRWRRHAIAFVADVEKMYRQIVVHPDDRDFQRILWSKGPGKQTKEYQLCTVTYGLACAPYLAMRCMQQLAKDEATKFPAGSQTLLSDVYMDDVLTGASTVDEARMLQEELDLLCKAGGFRLRKWASNSRDLLRAVSADDLGTARQWDTDTPHSVLGIQWLPEEDLFQIRCFQDCSPARLTKRIVLSQAAQIFDPLGWLAPVTVRAKIFLQSLWLLKTDWDMLLPTSEERLWRDFIGNLPALRDLQIPRWLGLSSTQQTIEVHGFSDASERAFSAVVYLRIIKASGQNQISLLSAKTKVAPLNRVSLPRLELCGAHLLTRLTSHTLEALSLTVDAVHLWTDSLVTQGWIQSHSSRWLTYVANRVADIQRTLPAARWHHVRSQDNPADCASRGLSPTELPNHPLWWTGPSWLALTGHWTGEIVPTPDQDLEEQRQTLHIQTVPESEVSSYLLRFSNFRHLLRVTAWCCRWLRKHQSPRKPYLASYELQEARHRLVRLVQQQFFAQEINCIRTKRPIPSRSRLLRLNPFLDEDGILRVGGRLQHSLLTFSRKHPAILPDDSHLAKLWADETHRRCLHGGTQLTLATLRQHCWILRGRPMVKSVIHRCPTCVRWKGNNMGQLMGNLPAVRVTPGRPFARVGIDYAGPILLRTSKGRGQHAYKGYIALFVCLATKAVHLEVVSDGTTDAFLAALRRFISRRGRCSQILSDCGTAFVGADRELRALQQSLNSNQLLDAVASEGIEWTFNPPAAPHFGGIWEAAVKSDKHHLRRVIGEHKLTYEEMATLLTEIEASLNSRPLLPLSDDRADLNVLTPGHFLIGEALNSLPERNLEGFAVNRLSRWQLVQQMQQHFWRVWSREYLNTLQTRGKWTRPQPSVKVGDLCLIKNELQPPSRWPLARVVQVHQGTDELTRVVTLKTALSEFTRPIHKIILLPRNDAAEAASENHSHTGTRSRDLNATQQ